MKKVKKAVVKFGNQEQLFAYQYNELIEQNNKTGNKNKLYVNNLETQSIVDKYIISHENNETFLLCHLHSNFECSDPLEIYEYRKNEQLIRIAIIDDAKKLVESPIMKLSSKTSKVNIKFADSNGSGIIDHYENKAQSFKELSLYQSITLFFILAPLSYLLLSILILNTTNYQVEGFLNYRTMSLGFVIMLGISIINYFFMRFWAYKYFNTQGDLNERV